MTLRRCIPFLAFFLVLALVYVFFVHTGLMAISNSVGPIYTPSDEEVNFTSALHTFRAEGLYKSFSIVYPPGRFLIQALFFKALGASIPTARLYFALAELLFPTLLFFLSYKIFKKYTSFFFSVCFAVLTTLLYRFFINSAQDTHIFVAVFFIVFFSKFTSKRLKNSILGFLLGVVFLFRIETGTFLILSMMIIIAQKRRNYDNLFPALLGFLAVWVPILSYITLTGSLKNFMYDTLYLGFIVHPQVMGLPIPPPPVAYVFLSVLIFIFSASLSLYIASYNHIAVRAFALFSILSFAAALDRSDEGHLWYGAVWLPFYVSYSISQLTYFKKCITRTIIFLLIPVSLAFFAFGYLLLKLKSVPTFILSITVVFYFFTKRYKKDTAFLILVSGLITSLVVFHSLSFLRLRFVGIPHVSFAHTFSADLFRSDAGEIAGVKFDTSYLEVLKKIKNSLDMKNKWLFIYPNHVIFYEYFTLKNPTRYYHNTGETTNAIQNEIITRLEESDTNNFIFFPEGHTYQTKVRKWILDSTYVEEVYTLGHTTLELRKRK